MSARTLTLAVPTRGRLAQTQATLLDFAAVATWWGHRVRYVVADDAATTEAFAWAPTLRDAITVYGRPQRAALVEALVAAGCDRPTVELGLLDPLGFGLTPGANRNFVQLVTHDPVVLTVDDDVTARLYRPREINPAVTVHKGDPSEFWFFDGAEQADPLIDDATDPIDTIVGGLELALYESLPPIVASWMGMAGDPGTPNGLVWLAPEGPSRARLMRTDDDYVRRRASRRTMRSVRRPTLCFGTGWTPGVVAYDHTRLLPPFFPVLRGQGLVWGSCVASGGAWTLARVPGALEHRMNAMGELDPAVMLRAATSMATSSFVQQLLVNTHPSETIEPAAALVRIADRLSEVSETAEGFDAFTRALVVQRAEQLKGGLGRLLEAHARQPESWARDVDEALLAVDLVARGAADWAPYDLDGRDDPRALLRTLVRSFAALLRAWPDMVATARTIEPDRLLAAT